MYSFKPTQLANYNKIVLRSSEIYSKKGVISIFLRAIVLQTDSPTERTDNPTFRVDSPIKPILAVFSPTNRWSYSPVRLSIRWSRPVYRRSYFL